MASTKVKTTKSDRLRGMFKDGEKLSVLATRAGMGYAFAYGVAKRTPHPEGGSWAERLADRRSTKSVTVLGDIVRVAIVTDGKFVGYVRVDKTTGKVTRSKS